MRALVNRRSVYKRCENYSTKKKKGVRRRACKLATVSARFFRQMQSATPKFAMLRSLKKTNIILYLCILPVLRIQQRK